MPETVNSSMQETTLAPKKFGTFLGVFTPSVLTILGVMMYLRFGWVVANVGLAGTVLIVLLCHIVSFITALSASAVATNMAIGTGGEYYLVSRSLGITIGGAIGIPLFLCRTLSVTLYCFGLAETVEMFWQPGWAAMPPLQWIAAGLVVIITLIAGKSANMSLRLQIPLMILVGLSLVALALGVLRNELQRPDIWVPVAERFEGGRGFWVVLAVFFPAVTGFTAGIGLSGDLADPQRSIPRGTLIAVLVGLAIYLTVPLLLSITTLVSREDLTDQNVWTRIAVLGVVAVFPGMFGAILSSAFGSALAGPRVLQSLAGDGLMPSFLARVSKTGQPTIATWVGGAIALIAALALKNLNDVAQLVSIFFLTLYVSINLVAATESLVRDPSYRPTLRIPWLVSLLGVGASLVIMFLINPIVSGVALGLELAVWLYLRRKDLEAGWGDVWAGLWGTLARFSLYKLTRQLSDPRSWRPNILVFANHVEQRLGLLRIAAWFNQNNGILTVCDVVTGKAEDEMPLVPDREQAMNEFFDKQGIVAFGEVNVVEEFEPGIVDIVQANGIGGLRPNTILFGWPARAEKRAALLRVLQKLHHTGKAAAVVRCEPSGGPRHYRRVDVWWRGKQNNGDLMLLLAHLLTLNPFWRRAKITVRSIVTSEARQRGITESLDRLIGSVRIKASRDVIIMPEDKSMVDVIHETSRDADVVFMGLMTPEPGSEEEYAQRLDEILSGLPTTIMVRNSGPFRGRLL